MHTPKIGKEIVLLIIMGKSIQHKLVYLTVIYITVPVATPIMDENPEVNATCVWVRWIPVADNRETMKGRVGGYTVSRHFHWIVIY